MENFTYQWYPKCEFNGKADPVKVGNELSEMGETVNERMIVDRARDTSTELNKCFEWDDSVAADKFRLEQARRICTFLHVVYLEEKKDKGEKPTEYRMLYHVPDNPGYTQTRVIVKQEDKYEALLKQARYELQCFKAKYQMLKELKPIFDLID